MIKVTLQNSKHKLTYHLNVNSIEDGVELILLSFNSFGKDHQFEATVIDINGSDNGWGLLKTELGFVFFFICMTPMNGFKQAGGFFYAYKIGHDPEKVDWPNVEYGEIPKHCFIPYEEAEKLVRQLRRSDEQTKTAGFHFDENSWEIVS